MKRDNGAGVLSAIFIDYDNIYLSLKRKSEEAARRFAKDAGFWLKGLETGQLITETNGMLGAPKRRIVMNRCYGNPVPRRNQADNSTDMNSFPFVRHHFLRAGFEVIDCPPLTAQLKNSADIRMVMDMRDYLAHETYFDEFIILSGDADFTPLLHRLRQHARKTVVYANDVTAQPYTAICDGEVREQDLINLLLEGRLSAPGDATASPAMSQMTSVAPVTAQQAAPPAPRMDELRHMIIAEVVAGVRASAGPVPLEALADRALRALGHDRTVGSRWAGAGSFFELLRLALPSEVMLSENPPYFAYDPKRHLMQAQPLQELPPPAMPAEIASYAPRNQPAEPVPVAAQPLQPAAPMHAQAQHIQPPAPQPEPHQPAAIASHQPIIRQRPYPAPHATQPDRPVFDEMTEPRSDLAPAPAPAPAVAPVHAREQQPMAQPAALSTRQPSAEPIMHRAQPVAGSNGQGYAPAAARPEPQSSVHQSIARIQEACQAPPLAPPEYRMLFEVIADEISQNGLTGAQTLTAITIRAQERGLAARREDVRFVVEAISETDPWFEQGASANLFAGRFRNFVVARCRDRGLSLSADELDLIDAWFAGGPLPLTATQPPPAVSTKLAEPEKPSRAAPAAATSANGRGARWWAKDEPKAAAPAQPQQDTGTDNDFPRIIRTRQRG